LKRWWTGGVVAVPMVAVACLDLTTDPDELWRSSSIHAMAVGRRRGHYATRQVLRRRFGACSGDGEEITGPVEFFTQQPTINVVSGDFLVADVTGTGTAGVCIGNRSTEHAQRVEIVAAPDSMQGGPVLPLEWVVPMIRRRTSPLAARVLSSAHAGVGSWIVRFQLEAEDESFLKPTRRRCSSLRITGAHRMDTTDGSGTASRRMRLRVAPGLRPTRQ
jgi:hypothetical protein